MKENQISCCPKSASEIKAWVKQKLNLSDNDTVFVSVCGSCENTAETIVMVMDETCCKENFRFFKIKKTPQQVALNDIQDAESTRCCMELQSVCYKEGKLVLS
jgi:hypothetical protein